MKKRAQVIGFRYGVPVIACFREGQSLPFERKPRPGDLVFRCPFCGKKHVHGAVKADFGQGNGERSAHCPPETKDRPLSFILHEVADASLAGDLRGF